MFDVLPFPNITGKSAEEKVTQMADYLIQFKEELEFVLSGIVSGDYGRLTTQPTAVMESVSRSNAEQELTVAEVINSAAFRAALNGVREDIPKKYIVSGKQTSEIVDGEEVQVLTLTYADDSVMKFKVKGGTVSAEEV